MLRPPNQSCYIPPSTFCASTKLSYPDSVDKVILRAYKITRNRTGEARWQRRRGGSDALGHGQKDRAMMSALTILQSFRPAGDPNVLAKSGKHAVGAGPSLRVAGILNAIKDPERENQLAREKSHLALTSMILSHMRMKPELENWVREM